MYEGIVESDRWFGPLFTNQRGDHIDVYFSVFDTSKNGKLGLYSALRRSYICRSGIASA
jgi:hypothetical protein